MAPRQAARAILLDPDDRLLLLRGHDASRPARGSFWFTVGGGVEPGEAPEAALRREIQEEVGIVEVELGPPVWLVHSRFAFGDRWFDQENTFYLAHTRTLDVDPSGQESAERDVIADIRWWTFDELRTTSDRLYPRPLVARLRELLRDGPPAHPVRLPDE